MLFSLAKLRNRQRGALSEALERPIETDLDREAACFAGIGDREVDICEPLSESVVLRVYVHAGSVGARARVLTTSMFNQPYRTEVILGPCNIR